MARPRKPRKPIAPGDTIKLMQHNAQIRVGIADEDAKHRAKLIDLSDREREVHVANITATVRATRLVRIIHQRAEEMRRHHAAVDRLKKRLR